MKKLVKIPLLIIFLIMANIKAYSQLDQSIIKANWVFIIGNNVILPNFSSIDTIKIAVYGKDSPIYAELRKLAKEREIKNKPVYVEEVTRINRLDNFNIIYLDETKNDFISSVYDKIHGTGKLLITYRSDDEDHMMINLLLKNKTEQFQIQSSNLYDEKIEAEDKLLSLGGSKLDVQGLFDKKVAELQVKEKELIDKEEQLAKKEQELNKLKAEVENQIRINEQNSKLIKQQTQELDIQKQNAQKLLEQVAVQEQVLKKNQYVLNNLNKEIYTKQQQIQEQNKEIQLKKEELTKQMQELTIQQKKIDEQKKTLNVKNNQIRNQKLVIIITTIFILVFLILSIMIWRSYRIIKKINLELKEKNIKIENQKEELQKQALQLEEYNKELSKLSLVASKTDNSVIICDKDLKIEWINSGFTRIYGYTLQLLINEKGDNLVEISATPELLRNIVNDCKETKKTQIYVNEFKTRTNQKIWVQTALTPVMDDNNELQKFIAIESNITKLKEQEFEILQMNEELQLQKAELEAQKERLEEVNEQIRDSISYGLTIQKAILPIDVEVSKHFTNFIIFKPKDIVSGDFYWWSNPSPNLYFFAVVDCTGHGVPGAFMSLIASRILNEVVEIHHYYEPKDILANINSRIILALSQDTNNNRDGLDICLVRIDRHNQTYKVNFSAAKRPLIYFDKNTNVIQTIKGSRRSIGGFAGMNSNVDFEQTEISLETNDILYLSSDGMIDQNNPQRKRFGSPHMLEILETAKTLPLFEQKEYIINQFDNFRQNEVQRDDITVWGIKL